MHQSYYFPQKDKFQEYRKKKKVEFVGRQHWPAILANRNFVNDVTSAKVGAQNHRAVGNAADVGWWKGGGA